MHRARASKTLLCLYGPRKVQKLLKDRFQQLVSIVRDQRFKLTDEVVIEGLSRHLSSVAWRYAQLAKHVHFKGEREWRFVIEAPDTEDDYCVGRQGLTPYRNTDTIEIKKIWIGPSAGPDPQVMTRTVTRFPQRHKVAADVAVWESPYVGR